MPERAVETAAAKVNLYLHVGGRRADGYHWIDSLIAFTDLADTLVAEPGEGFRLTVEGEGAAMLRALPDGRNLVLRAAVALAAATGVGHGAHFHLVKRIPAEAGLGGGSADAAAALRALARLWKLGPEAPLDAVARGLGADVPACLAQAPAVVGGVGHDRALVATLPTVPIVLAKPAQSLATAAVYQALGRAEGEAPPPGAAARFVDSGGDLDGLLARLAGTRNDLEPPARRLAPAVGTVLGQLARAQGCRLARMSGSGSACFALFGAPDAAAAAAAALAAAGHWSIATRLRGAGASAPSTAS